MSRGAAAVLPFLLLAACSTSPRAAEAPVPAPSAVWPDEGPMTWTPRATSAQISANDLRTRLYAFAHDSMLGRRIGEPGNVKGTAYIAREFERLGLRPAGDDGTYFQTLPFGPVAFDSTNARLAVGEVTLTAGRDWVPVAPSAANAYAGSIALRDVPTVFAGRLGDTAVALDPARFRGKVAVFLPPAVPAGATATRPIAPRCDSVPDNFGAAAAIVLDSVRRATPATRPAGPVRDLRAQRAGAVAVLVAGHDAASPAAAGAFASRMIMQPAPTPAGAPAGAAISDSTMARIFDSEASTLTVGAAGRTVSMQWSWDWRPTASPARNVIAILPGSDPSLANEYVLVGAHNDHVGTTPTAADHDSLRAVNAVTRRQGANDPVCRPTPAQQLRIDSLIARARTIRPVRRDSIMNGADDDGSGTVVMLEIAERFTSERPARSIIFVSHQGEEAGLLGSRWFVEHPTVPLASIVAAHNMDMVGKGRVEYVKFGGPNSLQTLGARRLSREFGDIIDSVNAISPQPMALDKSWDVPANPLNRFCRSDQVSYVLKNIPVTYFSTGYSLDYHQLTDEPQYVDYDHSARVARFIHDVMAAVADRRDRPAITGEDPAYPTCRR
ncbi:MAG TPA: M28 family peptidase [Gemmatimonadaceae bacterium]|nr:M28 family peptidase [Gemmatimonadaceae bacterium]